MKNGYLLPEWRRILRKAWSVRIALFWGAVNGFAGALAAFYEIIPPWWFLSLNVIASAAIAVARVTKQPGADI